MSTLLPLRPGSTVMGFFVPILLTYCMSFARATDCKHGVNSSVYRFSLGKISGVVVSDGPAIFEPSIFTAPAYAVSRSYRLNSRGPNTLTWPHNVVVLDTPFGRIMVDAGSNNVPEFPVFGKAGKLVPLLKWAGISPRSIDAILFTHAHPDHVSGITDIKGRAVFPNATIHIGKYEHEYWTNPKAQPPKGYPKPVFDGVVEIYRRSIAPYKNRIRVVRNGGTALPGFKFILTPGHSPGHCAIEVKFGNRVLMITGDTWLTKPDQVQNPEWSFFAESNAEEAFQSRVRLLNSVARKKTLVLAYHEKFPGLGYIRKAGPFFDWKEATAKSLGAGMC